MSCYAFRSINSATCSKQTWTPFSEYETPKFSPEGDDVLLITQSRAKGKQIIPIMPSHQIPTSPSL